MSKHTKSNGYDGIICGHIHRPEISIIDGIQYYNCGDMITSLTVLVETLGGEFQIIQLGEQ
jgi:UDP-2,3-diacylglucosamine pyrophosphatase LpxH